MCTMCLNAYVCVHGKGSPVKCIYKTGALAAQEDRIHTNFFFVLLLGTATLILIILVGAVTLIFVILRRTRKSTEETVCAREVVHVFPAFFGSSRGVVPLRPKNHT